MIDDRPLHLVPEGDLPRGVYRDASGHYVRVKIGAGNEYTAQYRPPEGTTVAQVLAWQERQRQRLRDEREHAERLQPRRGTLEADVAEYLKDRRLSKSHKKRRTQQLAWWCAQPAALEAPTISVEDLARDPAKAKRAGRLGLVPRAMLDPKRLRQILADAFAPIDPDADPTEFAGTSNHYRMALFHLFTVLDEDRPGAANPVRNVKIRPTRDAEPHGQDMRIVAEILRHIPSRFGYSGAVTEQRIAVLAWIHITPIELRRVDPPRHFHDVPDATREDILDGAITLTIPPRHKGQRQKLPAAHTIPLNPWGVAAMRAFAANPAAWGPFSGSSLNKVFKRACRRAQAALAKRGIAVDLSETTVYHLKHSLTTAAQLASPGLLDRQGRIQPAPGVQASVSHQQNRTTRFYTEAAVDPLVRLANAATTRYLEALFAQPLTPAPAVRLVTVKDRGSNL